MALLSNRIRGCIVGGALGDAIGLFTEFMDCLECQAQYGIGPKFKLVPPTPRGFQRMLMDQHRASFEEGSWTDGTSV
jgi:ADP-ribosylglycohydrolase